MRKLILALTMVVMWGGMCAHAHAGDDSKMDIILGLGEVFGAAEACGILEKNTEASAKILNGIDNSFTEKTDRWTALYGFTKSAMLSYKAVKDGTTSIKCSDVEKLIHTLKNK